jgi:hypothetical protein
MRQLDPIFTALSRSRFRSRFHLGEAERRYLQSQGLAEILEHGKRFIADRLAAAKPANDGKQTPMRGHPIFVAQHATATCCRSCLARWHGMPSGRELSAQEQAYIAAVIERWLREQGIPETPDSERQQRLF